MSIIFIGYKILEINQASETKQFLKICTSRMLGVLTPVLIFIIYLLITNTYMEFIDYAILGIGTFSNSSSYLNLLRSSMIYERILAITTPLTLVIMLIVCTLILIKRNLFEESLIKNVYILLAYSIADITAIYPIADTSHFAVGALCTLISSIYLVYNLIHACYKHIKHDKLMFTIKTFIEAFSILIFVINIGYSMLILSNYIDKLQDNPKLKHFNGILIDKDLCNRINKVDEYLIQKDQEGKTVYILDSMSAIFTIPIDKYYKNYDMFNLGNFGGKGENRNNRGFKKYRKSSSIY